MINSPLTLNAQMFEFRPSFHVQWNIIKYEIREWKKERDLFTQRELIIPQRWAQKSIPYNNGY